MVAYTDSTSNEYTANFDRNNINWQYLALPIKIDSSKTISSMTVKFDYSGNSSLANLAFLSLKEAVLEIVEYDSRERVVTAENTLTKEITSYTYRPDAKYDNITVSRLDMSGVRQSYTTQYEYNNYDDLLRTISPDGMVIENTYDEKGNIIATTNFNTKDPSSKLYSVIDDSKPEKNKALAGSKENPKDPNHEQFDDGSSVEYLHGTDLISNVADKDGNIISYGYDINTDRLLSVTMNIDGENNTNIYGYNADVLTRLSHNSLHYDYEYDGFGKLTKVLIACKDYVANTYTDPCAECLESNVKTIFANGEGFSTCTNDHDQITSIKYIDKSSVAHDYIQNTYDKATGLMTSSIDYSANNQLINGGGMSAVTPTTTSIEYDKFGQPTKAIFNQFGKTITESTTYHANGNVLDTEYKLDSEVLSYQFNYEDKYDGKLASLDLPNGTKQVMLYDELGRTKGVDIQSNINQSIISKEVHYMHFGDKATSAVSCVWYAVNGIVSDSIK